MGKQIIRLTESDLRKIIKESVVRIITENDYPDDWEKRFDVVNKLPMSDEQFISICKECYTLQDFIAQEKDCYGENLDDNPAETYEIAFEDFPKWIVLRDYEEAFNAIFRNGQIDKNELREVILGYMEGEFLSTDDEIYFTD